MLHSHRLRSFPLVTAVLSLLLNLNAACANQGVDADAAASLVQRIDDAYQRGDWDALLAMYHPDASIVVTDSKKAGNQTSILTPKEWIETLRTPADPKERASRFVEAVRVVPASESSDAMVYREVREVISAEGEETETRRYSETYEVRMSNGRPLVIRESALRKDP